MKQFEIPAEPRAARGTQSARRLRRTGKVPAILYGDDKDAVPLALDANELKKQLQHEAFFSHILTVRMNGGETQAVLKALQRHPVSAEVVHVDLLRVSESKELWMHVPLHFVGEQTSPGVKAGGVVTHHMVEVEVRCLPRDLPEFIEVDMSGVGIGDTVHLSELEVPSGVHLVALAHGAEHDQPVLTVQHARAEAEPGEEAEIEADEELAKLVESGEED